MRKANMMPKARYQGKILSKKIFETLTVDQLFELIHENGLHELYHKILNPFYDGDPIDRKDLMKVIAPLIGFKLKGKSVAKPKPLKYKLYRAPKSGCSVVYVVLKYNGDTNQTSILAVTDNLETAIEIEHDIAYYDKDSINDEGDKYVIKEQKPKDTKILHELILKARKNTDWNDSDWNEYYTKEFAVNAYGDPHKFTQPKQNSSGHVQPKQNPSWHVQDKDKGRDVQMYENLFD